MGRELSQGTLTTTHPDPPAAGTRTSVARSETEGAPARSFVVKFLHFQTKLQILTKAWKEKELLYNGKRITLDNDYSPALQRRWKEFAGIKKQLKEKGIKFQTRHPAKLLVHLESGLQVSAWEAADALRPLGIQTNLSEWEKLDREQHRIGWQIAGRDGGAAKRHKVLCDAETLLKKATSSD